MKHSILYLVALVLVLSQFFGFQWLALGVLLVMIISLLNAIDSKKELAESRDSSNAKLGEIAERVNAISNRVDEIKFGVEKSVFSLENKIDEVKSDYRNEMELQYRELARKIIDVENKLIDVRKTVGAAFGTIEDRLRAGDEAEI